MLVAAVLVAMLGVSTASPASAGRGHDWPGPEPEVLDVSGSFTATGELSGDCSEFPTALPQTTDGEGDWSGLGPSTFHMKWCLGDPPDGVNWPVLGAEFTVTTTEGTLTGTIDGYVQAGVTSPSAGFPFHLDLVIVGGTGRFETATGTLVLDGAFGWGAGTAGGTVSGTVTIPPGTPSSVDDCKHEGWRHYVDDEGKPFRNQGHCVAFVRHS